MPPPKLYPVRKSWRCTREQWQALRAYAAERGISEGAAVRELIEAGLRQVPLELAGGVSDNLITEVKRETAAAESRAQRSNSVMDR